MERDAETGEVPQAQEPSQARRTGARRVPTTTRATQETRMRDMSVPNELGGGPAHRRHADENMNQRQVVHEQDGDSGSPTGMALNSFERKCSLQAADKSCQNKAELVMRGRASAGTLKALAEQNSSTLKRTSMIRRNPPTAGIEKGKWEPREEASGAREGRESLE